MPGALAELGVRLVVVEPLPRTRLDGAAFWLSDDQPVIALSLRYDRIDWLWHTLAHELAHLRHGDERSVDANLVGESRTEPLNETEALAEREGAAFLIAPERLRSFIVRTRRFYTKQMLQGFALRQSVHPGIVSGQLQHLKELGWDARAGETGRPLRRFVGPAPATGRLFATSTRRTRAPDFPRLSSLRQPPARCGPGGTRLPGPFETSRILEPDEIHRGRLGTGPGHGRERLALHREQAFPGLGRLRLQVDAADPNHVGEIARFTLFPGLVDDARKRLFRGRGTGLGFGFEASATAAALVLFRTPSVDALPRLKAVGFGGD